MSFREEWRDGIGQEFSALQGPQTYSCPGSEERDLLVQAHVAPAKGPVPGTVSKVALHLQARSRKGLCSGGSVPSRNLSWVLPCSS